MKNNTFTEFMKAAKYYSEPSTEEKIRIAREKRAAVQSERQAIEINASIEPPQPENQPEYKSEYEYESEPECDYESEHVGQEVRAAKRGKIYYRRLYS